MPDCHKYTKGSLHKMILIGFWREMTKVVRYIIERKKKTTDVEANHGYPIRI